MKINEKEAGVGPFKKKQVLMSINSGQEQEPDSAILILLWPTHHENNPTYLLTKFF